MALLGVAPQVMRPTALTLNILVALVATIKFYRAGCFSWPLFWPFALTSIPFAFIGGALTLPTSAYKVIVGLVLVYAAYRLFRAARGAATAIKPPPLWAALILGAGIGLLSGLTGVGGGIFLSPLLLMLGWAEIRQTSGIAAAFILVNSLAGLLGQLSSLAAVPSTIPIWAAAVLVGGWVGAEYGSRRLNTATLRRLLAVVLAIAGLKLIFT
jgi:uncharacterized membrane protein YfcA